MSVCVVKSQDFIKCRVVAANDHQTLPFATIFLPKQQLGTSTDNKGMFKLQVDNKQKQDTIIVSYLGYETQFFTVNSLSKQKEIALKPVIKNLKSVDISENKKKINAKQLALKAISLYNKKRSAFSHISRCQAASYIKIDGQYCFYMESLGYAVYAEDNHYGNPLMNFKFYAENTRLADRNNERLNFVMKKRGNDVGLHSSLGIGLRSYQILNYHGVLDSVSAKRYSFTMDTIFKKNNEYYYSIAFKKGGKKGQFLLHRESLRFISLEQKTNDCWSAVKYKFTSGNEYYKFNYYEDRPYFASIKCEMHKGKLEEQVIITNQCQLASRFKVGASNIGSVGSYGNCPYIKYSHEAWDGTISLFENKKDGIEKDLRLLTKENLRMQDQYKRNSNKWYDENESEFIESGKEAIQFISTLSNNF